MSGRAGRRRPVRRPRRHPVVWSIFGIISVTALVVGLVLAIQSGGPPRDVVATGVGVLLFIGIAALVLAANIYPGGGGDASYGLGADFSSGSDGGGGDAGGGGDGGGDGGGGSW